MSDVRTIPWETIADWYAENEQAIRDVLKFEGLRGAVNEVLRLAPEQPEIAALREDLAESGKADHLRARITFLTTEVHARAGERDDLQQRLAAAERRNAECMALLAETSKSILRHQAEQPMSNRLAGLLTKARAKVDRYLKAALNPNPEAASHE